MPSEGEDFWFGIKFGLVLASPFWIIQSIMNGRFWDGHIGTLGIGAFFAGIWWVFQ